jgi:glucosamine-6-phosphate deaminase
MTIVERDPVFYDGCMEIVVTPDPAAVGVVAARAIVDVLSRRENPVLGVATGSSPLSTYDALADAVRRGEFEPKIVTAFALDEYVGIPPEHPESYHSVVQREVVEKIGLSPDRVHVLDGMAEDLEAACRDYEGDMKAAGGVDVQILGIGSNGHIGFNEPGSSLGSRTRIKTLAPQTRRDNARFFGGRMEDVPIHCLTQGIATIMDARKIVLVAQGAGKARAVAAMIEGPSGASCPASVLQWHRDVLVVLDEEAAGELVHREYYDFARDHSGTDLTRRLRSGK